MAIGQVYLWLGNQQEALPKITAAYEENSGCLETCIYYAYSIWKAGRHEEAIDLLIDLTRKNRGFEDGFCLLGMIYKDFGEYDKAIKYFKETLFYNDRNAFARCELGKTYKLAGDRKKALQEYRKLYETDPAMASMILTD